MSTRMKNSQLLKETLEGCVLLFISQKEVYGYELVQEMKRLGFTEIVGGTIYPLLQKLEKKEALSSRMLPSADGPDRKYYQLTPLGKELALAFTEEWAELQAIVQPFIAFKGGIFHEENRTTD